MSSRDSVKHTISVTAPTVASIGDEWVNPNTPDVLYKRTIVNGVISWAPVLITADATSASNTQTLSNKRITTKTSTAVSTSTGVLTPNVSSYNQYSYTALDVALTINAPIGSPLDGDKLMFRFVDNGTSQTLAWNSAYKVVGTVLPTATVTSKTLYVGCIYNASLTRWDVTAVAREA